MSGTTGGKLPYQDPNLPVEERVRDLLGRMTLREKARQLDQYFGTQTFLSAAHPRMHTVLAEGAEINWDAVREVIGQEGIGCIHDLYAYPEVNNALQKYAIEETRLGIPMLFSEEALHGLVRPGCSLFPHAITQAATFRPENARRIGRAIAAECRSMGIHETFSPVLDLAREPRWGRTEETYGEDTVLSARMGAAMVRGLQGESLSAGDSIIAEPKHYAVHGIPESGLNMSHTTIGEREMLTDYLPVFEAAIAEAGAVNVMCSYNAIDGVPCSAHRHLLTDVLRDRWGMRGFVRSDLGAVSRLQMSHRTAASAREAIRQALCAGTDMQYYDYPHDVFQDAIVDLVQSGDMDAAVVDTAVGRVLRVKFLLGLFETPYADPMKPARVIRSAAHTAVALETAREGITLLKNDGLLPLKKTVGTVAVIGPSAGVARLGDYVPFIEGFEPVTLLAGIRNIVPPNTRVLWEQGTGILADELEAVPAELLSDGHGNAGLHGEYFNNPDFEGEPDFVRLDRQVDFNWVIAKPDDRFNMFGFSVRWTGKLTPAQSFEGFLGTSSQDSMRLWVDGVLLADGWEEKAGARSIPFAFEAGRTYDIRLEYRKDVNGAEILLGWNRGSDAFQRAVEAAARSDVAILALGDNQKTCGEGIDRSELDLPGRQQELLRAIHATGTPVVLVLQNGRPITLGWESEHIPAIVEAWYPGEQGGTAMAEALFGDYNPAGRLPVSFPRILGQIPVYYNRKRGGQPRYIDGDNRPLYAFGHGLSYTSFAYGNLRITPEATTPEGSVRVTVDVTNTGAYDGDEVVQLYVSDEVSSVVLPEKELRKFERVHLKQGETKSLAFTLDPKDLRLLDQQWRWVVEPGAFRVLVGASSADIRLEGTFEVK